MSAVKFSPAQKSAVIAADRDLLVTAGAGTGKTTVLVERIVQRLASGALPSLEGLLVVTFTEKAAREMRDRIHRALREDPALRPLLPQLPRAAICTIHAFCARFLRERFLEAGLEPGFRVLDASAASQAYADALQRAFHDWYQHEDKQLRRVFQGLVEMSGFDAEGEVLRRSVARLHEYARTTEDQEKYLDGLLAQRGATRITDLPWFDAMSRQLVGKGGRWSEGTWTRGVRLYRTAIDIARDAGMKIEKHEALFAILATDVERLPDPMVQEAVLDRLADNGFTKKDGKRGIAFPSAPRGANDLPGFKELHEAAKKAFQHPLVLAMPWDEGRLLAEGASVAEVTRVLVQLVRDTDAFYRAFKRRSGFLDFSDLEISTLNLLRALGPRARGIYQESLVDEFQDVNRLQEELLSLLVPAEGRFRVGDVKQSIYQFRLADPTIFLGLMEGRHPVRCEEDLDAAPGPVTIFLAGNHRSRPAILGATNLVFERLFEPGQIGSSYEDQRLVPGREAPIPEPPVEFHGIAWTDDGSIAAGERQARLAARRLKAMVCDEKVMVPRREGSPTPATWRDAAVLLRTGGRAELFRRVFLEEGVPACLGAGGSLLEEEVVQDFRSLLRVIDNPRDDIALAAVFRSPLFGITDADLLRLRLARPRAMNLVDAAAAEAFRDDPEAEGSAFRPGGQAAALTGEAAADARQLVPGALAGKFRAILDRLSGWRAEAGMRGLGELLRGLLTGTGLVERMHGMGDYAGDRAAVEKFLALADSFEAERGPSLHGFLARLEGLEAAGGIEGVPLIGEGDDAVAILTMHRAKGLEYPLVVVPHLDWSFRRDGLGSKIRVGRDWIGLRRLNHEEWTQVDSWARRTLEHDQERAQREEEARVLYVALTRARERLVLLGTLPRNWVRVGLPVERGAAEALRQERLRKARSSMAWLLAVIDDPAVALGEVPLSFEEYAADDPRVCAVAADSLAEGDGSASGSGTDADAAPAPPTSDTPSPNLRELLDRLGQEAPHPPLAALGAAGLRGKYWVTELKTMADKERAEAFEEEGLTPGWPGAATLSAEQAAQRGTLYHLALSRLDFTQSSPEALDRQLTAYSREARWEGAPRDPAIEQGIAAFFATPTGQALRAAAAIAGAVEREVPFSLKVPVRWLLPLLGELRRAIEADPRWSTGAWSQALDETWVLVQGRIDCLFRQEGRWHVVDWKTDRLRPDEVAARAEAYAVQMRLYRDAVAGLWGEPGSAWLAFVTSGAVVEIDG